MRATEPQASDSSQSSPPARMSSPRDISRARAVSDVMRRAWRSAREAFLLALIEPLAALTGGLAPVFVTLMVEGALQHNAQMMGICAGILAGVVFLNICATVVGTTARLNVIRAVGHSYDASIARGLAAVPYVDQLAEPQLAAATQLLTQRAGLLAQIANGWLSALRIIMQFSCGVGVRLMTERLVPDIGPWPCPRSLSHSLPPSSLSS